MSIEDDYFRSRELASVDVHDTGQARTALRAFEDRRKPPWYVTELAYKVGRMFHHSPAAFRPIRDMVCDYTPLLQKVIGDQMPTQILSQLAEIDAMERRP